MAREGIRPGPDGVTVLRAAGAMGAATLASRFLGLAREQVFAYLFGAGNAVDAFNIAFRIPNLFRDLFAEGAMSAALVPTFTRARAELGDRRAWRVAGLVFRSLGAVVSVLALAGIVLSPWLVDLYASAFRAIPGKFELTVDLTRIMFPFFPLVALAAAYMGVLNSCGKYFLPALSSALFNLTSIVTGVGLAWVLPRHGIHPIVGMGVGVVAGGAVQAFCQLPSLYRVGYRWPGRDPSDPPWHSDPQLRGMLLLMFPGFVGMAATQVNVLVNSVLATSQGPGAVSWLNYAFRLMQFPIGVFGVALAAATLPVVSRSWVGGDARAACATLESSLRRVFAINFPASAGLAFLGVPIIQVLFEYGRFTPEDTRSTAQALAAYAVGLTAYSAVKVLVPVCYAVGRTRLAVGSSVASVGATIVMNLIMVGPLGFVGLALGTSIAAVLNAAFLMFALHRVFREAGAEPRWSPLVRSALGNLGAALVMGGTCYGLFRAAGIVLPDISLSVWIGNSSVVVMRLLKVVVYVAFGAAQTVLLAKFFGLSETLEMFSILGRKFRKKVSHQAG